MDLNPSEIRRNNCPHHHLVEVDPTDWKGVILARRETNMILAMQKIMKKPKWFRKIFDDKICDKWMSEIMSQVDFSEPMWKYCVAELRDKAKTLEETGLVTPIDVDTQVVYSDVAISKKIRRDLNKAVAALENVPDKDKDWHPGTRERVLDLVHPSMFPLIYGRSRVLKNGDVGLEDCTSYCGQGEIIQKPELPISGGWSDQFQWLPCDIKFEGEEDVKITSYINNLHPQEHPDIYGLVEKVIAKAVPLWDQVLSHTGGGPENMRVLVLPEPKPYKPREIPEEPPLDLRKEYAGSGLQVIVKLANTYLTPDDPEWDGGSWHVEGLHNEQIVATAIYYYSNTNITPSQLKFRHNGSDESWFDMEYEQFDYAHLETITGFQNEFDPLIQNLGSVMCDQGRLLAFPNVLQHNVGSFKLEDETKPGERKILALFLVNPHVRVLSTAKVPPQRKDWWEKEIREQRGEIEKLKTLPNELMDKVFDNVEDFPIGMADAKQIRETLMEERGPIGQGMIECEATFYFCEH
ncbi:hypothetical protein AUEXF2481DRAFT_66596 [Aureobasidium subglaciale EXF-2481]|uniref:Uncharacterized protein n=1 Tax=Aureobasidium subglaciale (strain EXF-2481) TaxID=1043005 RepID=A0A074YK36_AURSE|nr:uncharacterized protein AUEXF2481DRAFT_66596 [Aureobasidium subglaciale EXF-2481]KEQ94462.1 hypothetical protein AUEXF2481DRAFT_66596 [Aureobasidium subglaciale EXF-2481]